jgi:hypothetical protein
MNEDPAAPPAAPAEETAAPPLPAFVRSRADGIYVDPGAIAAEHQFGTFVERLFAAGSRFAGLDYPLFQRLAHDWAPAPDAAEQRLADAIVPFEPARRGLYKAVRTTAGGEQAEYFFEPAQIEVVERTPILGPPGEDGVAPVTGWQDRREARPTGLDPDELVAHLWTLGVRYGIDYEGVRRIIRDKQFGRFEVARMLAPEEGRDAGIEEVFAGLHRDNAPKRLADGRLDLHQFGNRFPQIGKGVAIFRKIPRRFGRPGRTVAGKAVEPAGKPKDLDLQTLAGPGTLVERRPDGDYIVAAMDGFLSLDGSSNLVSVTEKVVHTEGISLRTTGDLSLAGDEFETHGDVQERRVVEGRHMTFHGDVYGTLLSRGGDIRIDGNMVKARAASPGGSITVQGRASQAELRAVDGRIELAVAEGCTLIAGRVRVGQAYNCEIIAEQVEAELLEGCAVAALTLDIGRSRNRRDAESAISVLMPQFAEFRAQAKRLADELARLEQSRAALSAQTGELRGQPELAKFIALDMKLKKGEIKLTAAQSEQVHQAARRFLPTIGRIRQLSAELERTRQEVDHKQAELAELTRRHAEAAAAIGCRIGEVAGDTVVRTLPLLPLEANLSDGQIAFIRPRLRSADGTQQRLFAAAEGAFEWHAGGAGTD